MPEAILYFFLVHSNVRAVVATLGGKHGAAARADKWRHLYAGFTVWLSQSEAAGTSILLLACGLDILSINLCLKLADGLNLKCGCHLNF